MDVNYSVKDRVDRLVGMIPSIQDFPKPGILFRDVFPLMRNPDAFADCISLLAEHIVAEYKDSFDIIVGLDARGFIFGSLVAQRLKCAFVPIRKAGKLPGATIAMSFKLEYGMAEFELEKDSISPGARVIIMDDLLATGGTLAAAHQLLSIAGANVLESIVVIELKELSGRQNVPGKIFALLEM